METGGHHLNHLKTSEAVEAADAADDVVEQSVDLLYNNWEWRSSWSPWTTRRGACSPLRVPSGIFFEQLGDHYFDEAVSYD
jgi:hypothetical protein